MSFPTDLGATQEDLARPQWRNERRAKFLATVPARYRAWLHLSILNFTVLAGTAACLGLMEGPLGWAWLAAPALFVLANAAEWRAHKHWLHRRTAPIEKLYEQHTIMHHTLFVRGDMTWGAEPRLLGGILMPALSAAALMVAVAPLAALLWFTLGQNTALVFELSCLWYFASYEWLHLLCHVDDESWIGRRWLVRKIARHHALHHEPRLMQNYNFNVNFPLWDWVRGSFAPPELVAELDAARARDARASGRVSDRAMAA